MSNFKYLSAINLSHPTWDLILLFLILIIGFLSAVLFGKSRLVVVLFSSYVSYLILSIISLEGFTTNLETGEIFMLKAALFFGLLIILFLILSRSLAAPQLRFKGDGGIISVLFFSLSLVVMQAAIVLSYLPKQFGVFLAPISKWLFLSSYSLLIWIIFPIIVIFWIGRK